MSWSVNRSGAPQEVKDNLAKDFEVSKNGTASYPEEQKTVIQAEEIVNGVLDLMIAKNQEFVKVQANGSASATYVDQKPDVQCVDFYLQIGHYK